MGHTKDILLLIQKKDIPVGIPVDLGKSLAFPSLVLGSFGAYVVVIL